MRLLYISCHSILESEEISLFAELGIDVFAMGAYLNPTKTDDPMRPSLPPSPHWLGVSEPELVELGSGISREAIPKDFADRFDAIMVMHIPSWIKDNWEAFKHKIVIWRGIGQSNIDCEEKLVPCRADGMKIVRYSPTARRIPRYIGEDAIIRFYKDPEQYKEWTGTLQQVINITQNFAKRGQHCNYDTFLKATEGFPRRIYGPGNEDCGDLWGGLIPYDDLLQAYRDNRCYFYTGTMPASYTLNFIEAWMTGIPVVAIGSLLGNPFWLPGQFTYEIHELIECGETGFWSNDIDELRWYIKLLMDKEDVAKIVSEKARAKAIEIFGKEKIRAEWKTFFESL